MYTLKSIKKNALQYICSILSTRFKLKYLDKMFKIMYLSLNIKCDRLAFFEFGRKTKFSDLYIIQELSITK